jgi:acetyl-CoA carboxylase biotin carboxyl carrier protein
LLTFEQIKELIELVAHHQLAGLEVERSGFRVKIDGLRTVAAASAAPFASSAPLPGGQPQLLEAAPGAGAPVLSSGWQAAGTAAAGAPGAAAAAPAGSAVTTPAPAGGGTASAPANHILTAPIVGTFYRSPSPDASSFTEVGARVRKGQVVCIIEAMKLMNEIESDIDGTVVEIYPQNAQAVEFGEPLFAIRPG